MFCCLGRVQEAASDAGFRACVARGEVFGACVRRPCCMEVMLGNQRLQIYRGFVEVMGPWSAGSAVSAA